MAAKKVKREDKKKNKKAEIDKKETKEEKKEKAKEVSTFREYGEMIVEVLVFVFFINAFLLQSQTIPTPSMVDTMLIGDHLLVDKVAYSSNLGSWDKFLFPRVTIERGMIVTFKGPTEMEKDYVKRVIALPGETIRVRNKKVYINDKPLDEPYVYYEGELQVDAGDNFPLERPRIIDALGKTSLLPFYATDKSERIDEKRSVELCERFKECVIREADGDTAFKVPAGHYFCMGDNRDHSYDSRFWGPLPQEYIIGKPWRIYWSIDSETEDYLIRGIVNKIKDIGKTIIYFFPKTRWKRMFKKFE